MNHKLKLAMEIADLMVEGDKCFAKQVSKAKQIGKKDAPMMLIPGVASRYPAAKFTIFYNGAERKVTGADVKKKDVMELIEQAANKGRFGWREAKTGETANARQHIKRVMEAAWPKRAKKQKAKLTNMQTKAQRVASPMTKAQLKSFIKELQAELRKRK